jgi:hypothetical protein
MFLGGFLFFFSVFTLAGFTNPIGQNPAVSIDSDILLLISSELNPASRTG